MAEKEKKTVELKVKDIIPYSENPKKHPEEQINQIASAIKNYGYDQRIVVDEDNEVIKGHGRLKAIKKLGWDKVTVTKRYGLTEAEKKGNRLADNKVSETDYDDEELARQIEQIKDTDHYKDYLETVDENEMSEYLDTLTDEEDLEEPDTEDPEQIETDIQEGEVVKLGDHRLMCGDATKEEHVETLMDGNKADLVFTDPPYGMFLDTNFSSMKSKFKGKEGGNDYESVKGDNDDFKPELITSIFDNFDCEEVFIWGFDYFAELIPDRNNGSVIVWDKRLTDEADKMYGSSFELCWSKQSHKRDIKRVKWAGLFGMEHEHDDERKHPTQKPVKLSSAFITDYSSKENLIVDIYAGSGSTLLAAEQTNRNAYCMELDPQYCQVIINRWEELTGKKADPIT